MDASTTTRSSYLQPALVGGAVMGVLSALPFISAFNVCCCLWVVTGGVVAAYLFQQNQAAPISAADGALVGLLAGVFGAILAVVISIPIDILMAPMQRAMFERFLSMANNMPPEVRDALDNYSGQRQAVGILGQIVARVIGLVFYLFCGAIFSTLGGLLGAAIFAKKPTTTTLS